MSLRYDDFMNPLKGNAAFNLKTKIGEYKEKYFTSISQDMLVSCVYNKSRETFSFFFQIFSEGLLKKNELVSRLLLYTQ